MKKGKTSKLSIFDNAKCVYGTVDSINFKSLYINIQSWVDPKIDLEKIKMLFDMHLEKKFKKKLNYF